MNSSLTSRERVARAMRREAVDRTPVFCQLALGHYFLHAGPAPEEIWFTSEGFAAALVTLQRRYQFDGILINLPGRIPGLLGRVRRRAAHADGVALHWDTGEVTILPPDDNPRHIAADGAPLPRADFASLDPARADALQGLTGYWWNTQHVPWPAEIADPAAGPEESLRTLRLVRAAVGDSASVHGEVFSPFTHFMELLGYEAALLALLDDPGRATAWLDRFTESAMAWAAAQARAGADAVLISSAFAGGGFLSRAMYARFVQPHERRLAAAIRAAGVPAYTHTCGRIGDRLDLMAATEVDGLDTLDPPPLGNTDLATAKRELGARLFLKGNMNPVALLAATTAAEVRSEAERCLHAAAAGGGFILSTACSVAPRMEPWKLELLTPVVEEAGSSITNKRE